MNDKRIVRAGVAVFAAVSALGISAWAATTVQIGSSGKTFASSAVRCGTNQAGELSPVVDAGLFNPKSNARADVFLNGALAANVTSADPAASVWLADGNNTVVVALSKKVTDAYAFTVQAGMCALPDTSGNTFSADGTLEYAASGKSYTTVTPGCALNPATASVDS
jgi:hypothetical protein